MLLSAANLAVFVIKFLYGLYFNEYEKAYNDDFCNEV